MKSFSNDKILLAHGGGGRLMTSLIDKIILPKFGDKNLAQMTDSACLELDSSNICFTSDSFVVQPLFFNGGDIGKLAVCGTVNDIAVSGAVPRALSLSLIIEEGFSVEELEKILTSISETAKKANVPIVTGDTKVVEAGAADGIFINTAGVGTKLDKANLSTERIVPGDKIIINGNIGDHGMTIISRRKGIRFDSPLESDCAPLADLAAQLIDCTGGGIKFMRDPTRGGVAATLNEFASACGLDFELFEDSIPFNPTVRAAADMLGFDLLNIANEGKVVIVASEDAAEEIVNVCKDHPLGTKAAVVGQVKSPDQPGDGIVEMITKIGGRRIVQMPYGRELPRIC